MRKPEPLAPLAPAPLPCHSEPNAEFDAPEVIKWGEYNLVDTALECCEKCRATPRCNVWVWCGKEAGCAARSYRECWLKRASAPNWFVTIPGRRGPDVPWTSGALYRDADLHAALAQVEERLTALRTNLSLPLVYLDVAIKGKPAGRMEFVLFTDTSPRAAENFRALCTGEKGVVAAGKPNAGTPYHFKGRPFYRIIDAFIDQSGVDTDSVFGGEFDDDPGGLALKHDRKGLLSMANIGPNTNTAHFSIMMGPAPHLNGKYTIFGELVTGWETALAINRLSRGKKDNTATAEDGAVIVDSGQIR